STAREKDRRAWLCHSSHLAAQLGVLTPQTPRLRLPLSGLNGTRLGLRVRALLLLRVVVAFTGITTSSLLFSAFSLCPSLFLLSFSFSFSPRRIKSMTLHGLLQAFAPCTAPHLKCRYPFDLLSERIRPSVLHLVHIK